MTIKRLLLLGDMHGDLPGVKYAYEVAEEFECDAILQLGDCSYWEHQPSGIYYLDYIEGRATKLDIPFFFLSGNHENHTLLNRRYLGRTDIGRDTKSVEEQLKYVTSKKGPWIPEQNKEGFWKVRENLYYIPRPCVWTWNNVRFAALGGAFSIDINWREPGTSWWPEEMIEPDEVDALHDVGKVDIFLSHDVPTEVDIQKHFALRGGNFMKADQRTIRNRSLLSKAVEHTHPDYHFAGHYHLRYKDTYKLFDGHEVEIVGLDRDGTGKESWCVVDLKNDKD